MSENVLDRVRLRMGMVFQYSALFDSMSVGENVAFGLREHTDKGDDEIRHIVAEKLELVGLPGVEEMMPQELSGGMKNASGSRGRSRPIRRSSSMTNRVRGSIRS